MGMGGGETTKSGGGRAGNRWGGGGGGRGCSGVGERQPGGRDDREGEGAGETTGGCGSTSRGELRLICVSPHCTPNLAESIVDQISSSEDQIVKPSLRSSQHRLNPNSIQQTNAIMAPPAQSYKSPSPSQPSGKGEVSDLKLQLRQLAGSRAPGTDDSKRDLFKKVISYMTVGIDVSSLFSEMVMCSATSDIVLKKMCYLYVGNYAKGNPDLALLTINFLQKDCRDEDPMIRGLALRSLCSLRVANLVEYLVGPLGLGLKDSNGYVRMVAAIGAFKLYHISAATCVDADFPSMLKSLMLHDSDSQVVANCLSALQEIWSLEASSSEEASKEREALLSKPVIYYLLNRFKDFNEWAQCLVLDLVSKYVPSDSNDIFDIMNLLEDRLQHANGAVVLATVKVFLHMTLSMTDVHQQVYERIKAPLLTLVSSGSQEQSYALLNHLHLLVMRAPMLFSSDYKHFYCQYNEPSYVKKLKLDMLTAVANENNTYEIVTELCEYVANVDVAIARESVRAVGKIALQQYDVNAIVDRLLQFLEMEKGYVTAEALVLVKDLLRKYPQWSQDCIAVVGNISSRNVQEPKAKAALIWMLGEYCQDMVDAPYVLENLIENWDDEHSAETLPFMEVANMVDIVFVHLVKARVKSWEELAFSKNIVRLHLLTAVLKCFLKRPPETQKALGAALAAGLSDSHQDVHDRALLYYRLLQYNVSIADSVVNPPKQAVSVFTDTQNSEIKDRIFDEFNSLSVVYQKLVTKGALIFLSLNISIRHLVFIPLQFTHLLHLDHSSSSTLFLGTG
ncbi:hypothetical protein Syun_011958 [Stephania yunnanensis]|uniref:Clathrin/coatomer adaptor adaptin-like N-terminal domain-containing protein n=1 Tax=Stephania yunnanensis TaxID=152371 RepID=A0AAP0JYH5_9MAGN